MEPARSNESLRAEIAERQRAEEALRGSAADSSAAPVFDSELALKRCLNKPALLREIMGIFLADADRLLPQLRLALAKGDLAEVGRLGHRLKGTLDQLAAGPAREAAVRVERFMLRPGGQAEAEEDVGTLERECEVLKAVLRENRGTAASP
jgi:HPt (histidine-containing phosphotransfer) domain-containing protein